MLTKNLQNLFWDYKEPPKELHFDIASLQIKDGEPVIPSLDFYAPRSIKPDEEVELNQEYVDRKGIKAVVLVYDMLNKVSEKYGTWQGRIKSSLVVIEAKQK